MSSVHPLFSMPLSIISGDLVKDLIGVKKETFPCPECEGNGTVFMDCTLPSDFEPREVEVICERCNGFGKLVVED